MNIETALRSPVRPRAATALGVALALALSLGLAASPAQAGSGYFDFGVTAQYASVDTADAEALGIESGIVLGFERGLYFIKDGLAVALDYLGFELGLFGESNEQWTMNLPTIGVGVGTGFDSFMIYVGGQVSLFGMDAIEDEIAFSMLNPRAIGGMQVALGPLLLRGEFHLGHTLRFGDDHANYDWISGAVTLGYGFYSSFL